MLEVVDERGGFLRKASRAECHSDPSLIHRSVCVLVYNSTGQLFLQKRSLSKDLYADMWDLSATGHVKAGETCEQAAHRELREELGLDAALEHVRTLLVRAPLETELAAVFRCASDGPLHPNPDEIADGLFSDVRAALELEGLTPYAYSIVRHLSRPGHEPA